MESRQANLTMWIRADISLPSVYDELEIHDETRKGQVLTRLRRLGLKADAIKRGAVGQLAIDGSSDGLVFALKTEIVGGVAASHSFSTGFLAEMFGEVGRQRRCVPDTYWRRWSFRRGGR